MVKTVMVREFAAFVRAAVLALPWIALSASAANEAELSAIVEPYSHASVVERSRRSVDQYRIALGAMQKHRAVWGPEIEGRHSGELQRLTLAIDDRHSALDVFRFYQNRVEAIGGRGLYICHKRDCGGSNRWANDQFNVKQLYGLDGDQHYAAYEVVDAEGHLNFHTFYTVTRGNRRVFAHVELLKTQETATAAVAPNPELILQQLSERGYYIVSGVSVESGEIFFNELHLQSLVAALRRGRRTDVHIVGHDYSDAPLSRQQELSKRYADALRQKLIDEGVSGDRLQAHGIGSLAPAKGFAGRKQMRLEIVLK